MALWLEENKEIWSKIVSFHLYVKEELIWELKGKDTGSIKGTIMVNMALSKLKYDKGFSQKT